MYMYILLTHLSMIVVQPRKLDNNIAYILMNKICFVHVSGPMGPSTCIP